jgi:GT2 family glycosyltransferase
MDISVIVVTYNSGKYIQACIGSIAKVKESTDLELIVVDNHSADQTRSLIRAYGAFPRIIENPRNIGFARGVNLGLKEATGDLIILLNPDTVIKSASLAPLLDFLKETPRAGVCGVKLLNKDGSLQYSKGPFPRLLPTLYRTVLPKQMRKYHLRGYNRPGPCDWVTGAFMGIRREVVERIGWLDEEYFFHYEDVDYCLRARREGFATYFFPDIEAYHLNPYSHQKADYPARQEVRRGRLYFFQKNGRKISYQTLRILSRIVEGRLPPGGQRIKA